MWRNVVWYKERVSVAHQHTSPEDTVKQQYVIFSEWPSCFCVDVVNRKGIYFIWLMLGGLPVDLQAAKPVKQKWPCSYPIIELIVCKGNLQTKLDNNVHCTHTVTFPSISPAAIISLLGWKLRSNTWLLKLRSPGTPPSVSCLSNTTRVKLKFKI